MKKRNCVYVITAFLLVMQANPIEAKSFAGRESEMNAKCSVIYDKATQQECAEYKEYLENKNTNLDKEIDDIKNQISSVKGNIDKVTAKIAENNKEVEKYANLAGDIQSSIDTIQSSIATLNTQIKEKEVSIKERDVMMKDRLVEMQPYIGSNNFVDFIMGATSFTDLLRRTEIVGELNSYEREQIQLLSEEREQLAEHKSSVETKKELLEVQKQEAENNKKRVEALKSLNVALAADYHKEESALTAQKRVAQMAQASIPKVDLSIIPPSFDDDTNGGDSGNSGGSGNNGGSNNNGGSGSTDKPGDNGGSGNDGGSDNGGGSPETGGGSNGGGSNGGPSNSSGFITPVQGNWHYESGTWAYPGGGFHLGMDFSTGAATGLPVVAPANGIVVYSYGGCVPNNGGIPNGCGIPWGGGNNTLLLMRVNGTVYAMPFYHLNSATVGAGTVVNQGDVIGYTGSSGNSTGPHCHVEVINVGKMTLTQAVSKFNSTGDVTFGTGWGPNPNECGSAPCRIRPESFWL